MTLQQTIQEDTKRVKDLFARLEGTSDGAVKTRENLYGELSRDLRMRVDIEEQDLLPALRRGDETKELAKEVAGRSRELRAVLDELDALPKNDPSFRERLATAKKLFEQQVRDERTGEKALSPEQRQAVEGRIEARRAAVEEQRRLEEEERREEARRDADRRRAAEARDRAAEQVADAAKSTARSVVIAANERAHEGAVAIRDRSQRVALGTATAARRVRDAAGETVDGYRESVREGREDVKAIAGAVRNFAKVGSELGTVVVNSVKQSARNRMDMARKVARTPLKLGQLQREYAAAASRNRIEAIAEAVQIVRSASTAARQPLEERLREVA